MGNLIIRNKIDLPKPVIPSFSDPDFYPSRVRQERIFSSHALHKDPYSRFINEGGKVNVLSFDDSYNLIVEVQWCLFKIKQLKYEYPVLSSYLIPILEKRLDEATNELFMANRLLIVKAVRKFSLDDEIIKDFIQEVSKSLFTCIEKFDISFGYSFYGYAKVAVSNKANNHFRDCIRNGYINPIMTANMVKVSDSLKDELNIDEIMEYTGLSEKEVKQNIEYLKEYKSHHFIPISLDEELNEDEEGFSLYNTIEDPKKFPSHNNLMLDDIKIALNDFTDRERQVIQMKYFDGYTFEEIGEKMNVSRTRIKQIEGNVLKRLKQRLNPIIA